MESLPISPSNLSIFKSPPKCHKPQSQQRQATVPTAGADDNQHEWRVLSVLTAGADNSRHEGRVLSAHTSSSSNLQLNTCHQNPASRLSCVTFTTQGKVKVMVLRTGRR